MTNLCHSLFVGWDLQRDSKSKQSATYNWLLSISQTVYNSAFLPVSHNVQQTNHIPQFSSHTGYFPAQTYCQLKTSQGNTGMINIRTSVLTSSEHFIQKSAVIFLFFDFQTNLANVSIKNCNCNSDQINAKLL